MTSDFSLETIEDRRQNFISCEIYFKNEDKIKTFSNKLRLTEFCHSQTYITRHVEESFSDCGEMVP